MSSIIQLTPAAHNHFQSQIHDRGRGTWGVLFAVAPAGCSGQQYVVEFYDLTVDDQLTHQRNSVRGVTIVVPISSIQYLKGSIVDYVTQGLSTGIDIQNPNVVSSCGCNQSFQF